MNATETKAAIKGCNNIYWRAGSDTCHQRTGRSAHAVLRDMIRDNEECNLTVTVIGKTAWLDAPSWTECH